MPSDWFARHKLRFRRKPVEQPGSTTAPEIQLTSNAPAPQTESSATNGAPEGQSSPPSIWDTAYDNVRLAESKLVDAYESILSASLGDAIEQRDATKRLLQMERLAQAELDKAVKRDGAKKAASQVIQVVLAINAVVKEALQTLPPGVLAWTGVCFSLQVSHVPCLVPRPIPTSPACLEPAPGKSKVPRWPGPYYQEDAVVL